MEQNQPEQVKQHYYLVAGSIVIEQGPNVQAIPQNALLITDTQVLGVRHIARAQQALQVTLSQKLGGQLPAGVVDVLIMNLQYMGFQTQEEFQSQPELKALREKVEGQSLANMGEGAEVIDLTGQVKG